METTPVKERSRINAGGVAFLWHGEFWSVLAWRCKSRPVRAWRGLFGKIKFRRVVLRYVAAC